MPRRLKSPAEVRATIATLRELWKVADPDQRQIIEIEARCLKTLIVLVA